MSNVHDVFCNTLNCVQSGFSKKYMFKSANISFKMKYTVRGCSIHPVALSFLYITPPYKHVVYLRDVNKTGKGYLIYT